MRPSAVPPRALHEHGRDAIEDPRISRRAASHDLVEMRAPRARRRERGQLVGAVAHLLGLMDVPARLLPAAAPDAVGANRLDVDGRRVVLAIVAWLADLVVADQFRRLGVLERSALDESLGGQSLAANEAERDASREERPLPAAKHHCSRSSSPTLKAWRLVSSGARVGSMRKTLRVVGGAVGTKRGTTMQLTEPIAQLLIR